MANTVHEEFAAAGITNPPGIEAGRMLRELDHDAVYPGADDWQYSDEFWDLSWDDKPERRTLSDVARMPEFAWVTALWLIATLFVGCLLLVVKEGSGDDSLSASEATATRWWLLFGAGVLTLSYAAYVLSLRNRSDEAQPASEDLFCELWAESRAMATYAIRRGFELRPEDAAFIERTELLARDRGSYVDHSTDNGTTENKALIESLKGLMTAKKSHERLLHQVDEAQTVNSDQEATKELESRQTEEKLAALDGRIKKLGRGILRTQKDELIESLAVVHYRLATLVDPAMPKTLRLLNDPLPPEGTARHVHSFPWLGSVRLVRMMFGLIVILIPLFVALAVSVGTSADTSDELFRGDPIEKFHTASYLFVASALGAAFAALFKAFRYIGNLSYDDKYESSYWVRFILGIVAGVLLSLVLSRAFFGTNPDTNDIGFRVTVPLLALVGGFSSDLVYRMLNAVVEGLKSMVRESNDERIEAQKQQAEARQLKRDLANKQDLVADIIAIRNSLPEEGFEDARHGLDKMMTRTLGVPANDSAAGRGAEATA